MYFLRSNDIKRRLRPVIAVCIFWMLVPACSQHFQTAAEAPGSAVEPESAAASIWPHSKSDLEPDPALSFGKLENGFRYVLMRNANPRDRVSMHLNVQAGSVQEADSQQGLAHFLEHMLFNGSEHFEPGELVKYFQSIGMQFGADANAHTGFFETVYDIFLPAGDRKNLEDGLLVMHDYAGGASLLQEEVERERNIILAEKRSRDSASYRTFVASLKFELPDARIAQRLPIGKEAILKQAGRPDLKSYYDAWYRPDNMILVAVGDFDMPLMKTLVENAFSDLTPRSPAEPPIDLGKIAHDGIKTFHHYEKESGNTSVTIEVLTRAEPGVDNLAYQKAIIRKTVADRIVQNRLDALVGRTGSPGTDAAIGSGLYLNHIEYAMLSAEGEPDEWDKILAYLEQTLRSALTFGFTEGELERVKKDFLSELTVAVKKKETRESKVLARQIIRDLNANRVTRSPDQEKKILAPFIEQLTLAEVNASFRQVWAPGHRLVMVTGNTDLSTRKEGADGAIAQVYHASLQVGVAAPVEKKITEFPYLPRPQKNGRIVSTTKDEESGIVQVVFDNGFSLNLKKTDFKDNEIVANLSFGTGRFSEPSTLPGLAELSAAVVNESGLGMLEKDEIEAALAGKNTAVAFDVGTSRFTFRGETIPEELELLFQLLFAHLQDPGFKEEAFTLSMKRFEQQYQSMMHSIDGAMALSGWRFFAGGDKRFGLPPFELFSELTLDQVRGWVSWALADEPLALSIVGDFEKEKVIELAGRYFGSLPHRTAPNEMAGVGPVFPNGETLRAEVETKIPNAMVLVAYPTDDIWDISKTRRLSVLADLFSERLRVTIREKMGESYSPYAYNRPSRVYEGFGYLVAVVETHPSKIDLVIGEVKKMADELARNGVSDDEIHRVVEPTLNRIKDMRKRNGYWLGTVLTGANRHPQQIAWSHTIETDYASIDSEDAAGLAKRYLVNEKAAVFVAAPDLKD